MDTRLSIYSLFVRWDEESIPACVSGPEAADHG
jgi:hypothetical protein